MQLEGHSLSLGGYLITTNVEFESALGVTGGTDQGVQAIPQLHYVFSPSDSKLTYGVGLYVPYGLGIDYGNSSPFPTLAQQAELAYLSLNPVVAYEVTSDLSIAAGVTLNYSRVELKQAIGLLPGDQFKLKGDDIAYGFNLGLLWKFDPRWSLGVNYRSETELNFQGDSSFRPLAPTSVSTDASLVFPMNIDFGLAYRPNDDWIWEVNLDWTNWNRVDGTEFEGTALGDLPFAFNYQDTMMYEFGITRVLGNDLLLSFGYIFSENSVPDQNFSPLNPDSDLQLGSIGISRRAGSIDWAVAYHFAYNGGRTVKNNQSGSLIGETADGRYTTFNQAINLSINFSF